MTRQPNVKIQVPPAASAGKIAMATIVALLVAGVILVTTVLPAEYGIDPLGTGKALGLLDLAGASGKEPAPTGGGDAASSSISPRIDGKTPDDAPMVKNTFLPQTARYKVDSREIVLHPGEGMEIKYHMPKGGGLLYSWIATDTVTYEFHGEPDKNPPNARIGYYESYDLDDKVGKKQSHGVFLAPSEGIHGWFWQNPTKADVTLNLVSSGNYDWIFQNRNDEETTLQPADPK